MRHRDPEAKNDFFSDVGSRPQANEKAGVSAGLKKSDRLTAGTTPTLRESMTRARDIE